MVDGFHWTRVTSKQLRFLYEDITTLPPPPKMKELADAIDRGLAAAVRGDSLARAIRRSAGILSRSKITSNHGVTKPLPAATGERQAAAIGFANDAVRNPRPLLNVCCMNVKE